MAADRFPRGERSRPGSTLIAPDGPSRPRVSRPIGLAFFFIASYVVHVRIPHAFARRGPRIGWGHGRPSLANRLGLVPLAAGAGGLTWCYLMHYEPGETVAVSLVPEQLLASGPYRFSRNPMYVAEAAMWLGWSLYYGSPAVSAATAALAAGMRYAVGREETTLRQRFGDQWADYAARVPRWI